DHIYKLIRAIQFVKLAITISPDRKISLAVAVIIVLSQKIGPGYAPRKCQRAPVRASINDPRKIVGGRCSLANYRKICLAITIIVARSDQVAALSPLNSISSERILDIKRPRRRRGSAGPLDSHVKFSIAVVITGCQEIAFRAERNTPGG